MFIYGKTSANAIAVMSYLATDSTRRAGSAVIAASRGISPALTAKILTQLAAAGFVAGQPGPGGGYRIGKPAAEISLMDVISLFEQSTSAVRCPFGENWCETNDPCPLHEKLYELLKANRKFLEETTFAEFRPTAKTCCQ